MDCRPTVVATGLVSCAGEGVKNSFDLALKESPDAFEKLNLFESPRYFQRLVGAANIPLRYSKITLCGNLLMCALDEAIKGLDKKIFHSKKAGLFLGTSIGGIFETENMIKRNFSISEYSKKNLKELAFYECSTLAELAAKKIGIGGVVATFSTACSSSGLALSAACDAIEQKILDVAVVCGADSLSRITVNGFGSLLLLSQGKCKPFDENRDGINLGEGAGVMVLMSAEFARKAEVKAQAYLSGWACTADAYHSTAPQPDGEGAAQSIKNAIKKANLSVCDISYYIAHGTGTKGNDIAEYKALESVFAEKIPHYASIKRAFGHTLGASGILNSILAVEAIKNSKMFPNAGLEKLDSQMNVAPLLSSQTTDLKNILTVSLGFGGNNCAIVVSKNCAPKEPLQKKKIFVYSCGLVSSIGIGFQNIKENIFKPNLPEFSLCPSSDLLPKIPVLKKRKWAKLQQMALHSSIEALENLNITADLNKIGVCFGTGLGMTAETQAFIESTLQKNESEPKPTAFTNSVHNAMASLISLNFGFKGLNSAATAKEASFEAALCQAIGDINSGATNGALVGAADEFNVYAQNFLAQNAKISNLKNTLTDFSAAFFLGEEGICNFNPIAEIKGVNLRLRHKNSHTEALQIEEELEACGVLKSEISHWFVSGIFSDNLNRFIEELAENLQVESFQRLDTFVGSNYSSSAFAIAYANMLSKKGNCFVYTPTSTNRVATTIFKAL